MRRLIQLSELDCEESAGVVLVGLDEELREEGGFRSLDVIEVPHFLQHRLLHLLRLSEREGIRGDPHIQT